MKTIDTSSSRHQKFFDEACKRLKEVSENSAKSIVGESMAQNMRLAELLTESRVIVEDGVCEVIDALDLAFEAKNQKIKRLEGLIEVVSSQVAFLKTSLSTVAVKTVEVDALIKKMEILNSGIEKFNSLVESGCFDRMARAAKAISV